MHHYESQELKRESGQSVEPVAHKPVGDVLNWSPLQILADTMYDNLCTDRTLSV
jgi:hypothetical protein